MIDRSYAFVRLLCAGALFAALVACSAERPEGGIGAGGRSGSAVGTGSAGRTGGSFGTGGSGGSSSGSTGQAGALGGIIVIPDAAVSDAPASMACAEESHEAEAAPVDVMLLVDSSSSMGYTVEGGTASKRELAHRALATFVGDPRSAGLGVGLEFFPYQPRCTTDADCGPGGRCAFAFVGLCVDPAGVPGLPCVITTPGSTINCAGGSRCIEPGNCESSFQECANPGQTCKDGSKCLPRPRSCTTTNTCDAVVYENATVAIAALPGNEPPLVQALREKMPSGGTPLHPAVQGVLKQMQAHLVQNPGRKGVLVVATDGAPSCGGGLPEIAETVRAAQQGTPSISTYVIGVFARGEVTVARPGLDSVAMAGGTGQAFVINADPDLAKKLGEALDAIRGSALACEFAIPPPKTGVIDPFKVNVRYTNGGAAPIDLPYVKTMAACDPMRGGWYYDAEPPMSQPSRIVVCPSTCQQFKNDGSAKVDLVFGCVTKTID